MYNAYYAHKSWFQKSSARYCILVWKVSRVVQVSKPDSINKKKAYTKVLSSLRQRLIVTRDGCVHIFWAFWEKCPPTNENISRSELGTKVEGVASEKFPWTISEHDVEIGLVACPSLQGTLIGIDRQACFCLNHGPLLLTLFNLWHMIFFTL